MLELLEILGIAPDVRELPESLKLRPLDSFQASPPPTSLAASLGCVA
jgi:hypothetical protein